MSLRSKRKNKPAFNIDLIDKASHLVVDLTPAKVKLPRPEAYSEAEAILAELKEAMDKANKTLYTIIVIHVAICCTCTCKNEDHFMKMKFRNNAVKFVVSIPDDYNKVLGKMTLMTL